MDRRFVRAFLGLGSIAAAVGAAVALAPASLGRVPVEPVRNGTCTELAAVVDPKQVPVDTGYDPERNLIYAHQAGRTYAMSPDDPVCRALTGVKALIDDEMQAHRQNMTTACEQMVPVARGTQSELHGRQVDRTAAKRFFDDECAGVPTP
jgi:hypothetical protein